MRTMLRNAAGQVLGGPTGVSAQSRTLIACPSSPPLVKSERSRASSLTALSRSGW